MKLLALLCAAVSWLVARRAPQHKPVAFALALCTMIDVVRWALPLPPRIGMAMYLLIPAISTWLYDRVWSRARVSLAMGVIVYVCSIGAMISGPWELPMIVGYCGAVIIAATALTEREPWTVTQRIAAMLLAGDIAGLVLLCARETIAYQAGVVLGLVTVYQLWWLWRWRLD